MNAKTSIYALIATSAVFSSAFAADLPTQKAPPAPPRSDLATMKLDALLPLLDDDALDRLSARHLGVATEPESRTEVCSHLESELRSRAIYERPSTTCNRPPSA